MEILWQQEEVLSVRDVHEALLQDRPLAYTTVMTVLDRLAKKGIVSRERGGRAWLYRSVDSRADLVLEQMVGALMQSEGSGDEVLRRFVKALDEHQRTVVGAELEAS
ncbi:BlaI/MecI/CopY family transcriptional regulator [Luteococcus sediminum]